MGQIKKIKTIGIMTGGGDCPGLNAAIRAVVRSALKNKIDVVGYKFGWRGIIEDHASPLGLDSVSGILTRGGTILGSSRTNPVEKKEWPNQILSQLQRRQIDALVIIGGDGTLRATYQLSKKISFPFVAIPKTIDNDIDLTDVTFGFDTAVSIATEAIDRIHSTAESHQRVMVVEVMGRDTGWIAAHAGIAGGADFILIPEVSVTLDQIVSETRARQKRGMTYSIIVVAEGASLKVGNQVRKTKPKKSIGQIVAQEIEKVTGFQSRVTILGYVQRGGTPTAYDRVLATRMGVKAVQFILEGKFGEMLSLQGTEIKGVVLAAAVKKNKACDLNLYHAAKQFFG